MDETRERPDAWGGPTQWSLIERAAGTRPGADVQRAWHQLLERYRLPVERSVRSALHGHPQADEAAADFFAYLYQQELLQRVDRDQGRFRCYMHGVIRRFTRHWLRTGGSLNAVDASELDFGHDREEDAEIVRAEEQAWAEAVLATAVTALRKRHPREAEFLLRAYGIPPYPAASREELCAEHGLNVNQLNVAIHRARGWLRDLILREIGELVADPGELEREQAFFVERLVAAHPGMLERESGAGAAPV